MSFRSAYAAGAVNMGAPLFDNQITRAENMVAATTAAVDRAANSVKGVKSALVVNAVVTGVSTVVLVASALRMGKRARRG